MIFGVLFKILFYTKIDLFQTIRLNNNYFISFT